MADTCLLAQVSLPSDSGLPEDAIVNTFHFRGPQAGSPAVTAEITTLLAAQYQAIDEFLSEELSGAATIKFYDMLQPTPRAPIAETTFTITPAVGTSALPSEVALCLSYQGPRVSGTPQARRRGRVYFGPFVNGTNVTSTSPSIPVSGLRTALANFGIALANASLASGSWYWVVFSPTLFELYTVEDSTVRVTNGWVDAAWDTQRRRGPANTTRTLWAGS